MRFKPPSYQPTLGGVALNTGAAFLLGFLLSGCQLGDSPADFSSYAEIPRPDEFKAETIAQPAYHPDRFWVSDFGDPQLDEFVRKVLECNRDVKAAEAAVQIAAINARIVASDLYPEVELSFGGERRKQNFVGFSGIPGFGGGGGGGVLSTTTNRFSLLGDISWDVDLWGVITSRHSEAIAQVEASQFDKAALELSLAAQTVRSWFVIAEAVDQVELARSTLATFRETEEAVRDRFERGIGEGASGSFSSQLLLAQTDVAIARDALAAREEIVERTARELEVLAGKYPCGKAGKNASLPEFPDRRPISLPCTVLDRRPDLVAEERRLAASDERLVQAKRVLFPTLSITSDAGTVAEQIEELLDGNFSVWSLAGKIARPIFRGGEIRALRQQVYYERKQVAAQFEQAVLTAFREVENALATEKYLADRVEALREAASLSREAYQRSREEYANGTGDILTMLTAQRGLFAQESQLLTLRRQQLEARVTLHLALAGSFECIEPINPEPLPDAEPGVFQNLFGTLAKKDPATGAPIAEAEPVH